MNSEIQRQNRLATQLSEYIHCTHACTHTDTHTDTNTLATLFLVDACSFPEDHMHVIYDAMVSDNYSSIIMYSTQVSMLNHMCCFCCCATLKVADTCVTAFVASQP